MKTHSKPHQVMIGRSALLSDSLPWSSDKTGRNPCGPVAIRIRQREFWSIRYHEYILKNMFQFPHYRGRPLGWGTAKLPNGAARAVSIPSLSGQDLPTLSAASGL